MVGRRSFPSVLVNFEGSMDTPVCMYISVYDTCSCLSLLHAKLEFKTKCWQVSRQNTMDQQFIHEDFNRCYENPSCLPSPNATSMPLNRQLYEIPTWPKWPAIFPCVRVRHDDLPESLTIDAQVQHSKVPKNGSTGNWTQQTDLTQSFGCILHRHVFSINIARNGANFWQPKFFDLLMQGKCCLSWDSDKWFLPIFHGAWLPRCLRLATTN